MMINVNGWAPVTIYNKTSKSAVCLRLWEVLLEPEKASVETWRERRGVGGYNPEV